MKERLTKILIAFVLFVVAMVVPFQNIWFNNGLFIIAYLLVGAEVVKEAIEHIIRGKILDENFLMTIATFGAFAIGEIPEAVAVMLFYQIGEYFQSYAVNKSRKSISELMDIRPDYANVLRKDEIVTVNPDEVKMGEIIVVKPGEKIPLDGKVVEGDSMLDTVALTGESIPRDVTMGDEVLSGCINKNGVLKIEVTKEYGESTVNKILNLVENASNKKAKAENFISKFARVYTPTVVIIAVLLATVPMLIIDGEEFSDWLYRSLAFLVVSCPCALVISIPLSFFGGIGGASRMGILIKGSNYLEALGDAEIAVFDKTGTLTEGVFEVQKVDVVEGTEEELIEIVAHAEYYSDHPISYSIKRVYNNDIDQGAILDVQELSGKGVYAKVREKEVLIGNEKLMKENSIEYIESKEIGTVLYAAIDKKYAGCIVIADKIKEDSLSAIKALKKHIKQIVMLTGDKKEVGENVAKTLNIDKIYTELLPNDKVEKVEELIKTKSTKGKLVFVGDGINDAPVLALADVGIAMGGLGADAAIEAADVVIMTDEPSKVESVIKLSKRTMRIVKENIVFAISVKVVVLVLSALGLATMWEAVFADVGVSVIAVLNALRALKIIK